MKGKERDNKIILNLKTQVSGVSRAGYDERGGKAERGQICNGAQPSKVMITKSMNRHRYNHTRRYDHPSFSK